uniref:Uncharacterized protein n=1 Tax=Rhizophora mucronata TaxID=61149 RepID=A0A2P2KX31_RHIMU
MTSGCKISRPWYCLWDIFSKMLYAHGPTQTIRDIFSYFSAFFWVRFTT